VLYREGSREYRVSQLRVSMQIRLYGERRAKAVHSRDAQQEK